MTNRTERVIAITKDVILFCGGLSGIAWQTLSDNVNLWLLIVFTTMIGTPGITNLVPLLRAILPIASGSSAQVPSDSDSGSPKST